MDLSVSQEDVPSVVGLCHESVFKTLDGLFASKRLSSQQYDASLSEWALSVGKRRRDELVFAQEWQENLKRRCLEISISPDATTVHRLAPVPIAATTADTAPKSTFAPQASIQKPKKKRVIAELVAAQREPTQKSSAVAATSVAPPVTLAKVVPSLSIVVVQQPPVLPTPAKPAAVPQVVQSPVLPAKPATTDTASPTIVESTSASTNAPPPPLRRVPKGTPQFVTDALLCVYAWTDVRGSLTVASANQIVVDFLAQFEAGLFPNLIPESVICPIFGTYTLPIQDVETYVDQCRAALSAPKNNGTLAKTLATSLRAWVAHYGAILAHPSLDKAMVAHYSTIVVPQILASVKRRAANPTPHAIPLTPAAAATKPRAPRKPSVPKEAAVTTTTVVKKSGAVAAATIASSATAKPAKKRTSSKMTSDEIAELSTVDDLSDEDEEEEELQRNSDDDIIVSDEDDEEVEEDEEYEDEDDEDGEEEEDDEEEEDEEDDDDEGSVIEDDENLEEDENGDDNDDDLEAEDSDDSDGEKKATVAKSKPSKPLAMADFQEYF